MRVISAVLLVLLSNSVIAQDETGPYFGFGVGLFDYEEEAPGAAPGFSIKFSDSAASYKLYGGYRFSETWAFEGAYGSTSDLSDTVFGIPISADYDVLEVRGIAHLGTFLAGFGYFDADVSASAFGESVSDSDSGATVIIGGEWARNDWRFRVEYEIFDTESSVDAFVIGFGAHFRF